MNDAERPGAKFPGSENPGAALPGLAQADERNTDSDEEINLEDTLEWRGAPDGPRPA